MTPAEILQYLPLIISGLENGYQLAQKLLLHLQQNTELTAEEIKQRDAIIDSLNARPWWQPTP